MWIFLCSLLLLNVSAKKRPYGVTDNFKRVATDCDNENYIQSVQIIMELDTDTTYPTPDGEAQVIFEPPSEMYVCLFTTDILADGEACGELRNVQTLTDQYMKWWQSKALWYDMNYWNSLTVCDLTDEFVFDNRGFSDLELTSLIITVQGTKGHHVLYDYTGYKYDTTSLPHTIEADENSKHISIPRRDFKKLNILKEFGRIPYIDRRVDGEKDRIAELYYITHTLDHQGYNPFKPKQLTSSEQSSEDSYSSSDQEMEELDYIVRNPIDTFVIHADVRYIEQPVVYKHKLKYAGFSDLSPIGFTHSQIDNIKVGSIKKFSVAAGPVVTGVSTGWVYDRTMVLLKSDAGEWYVPFFENERVRLLNHTNPDDGETHTTNDYENHLDWFEYVNQKKDFKPEFLGGKWEFYSYIDSNGGIAYEKKFEEDISEATQKEVTKSETTEKGHNVAKVAQFCYESEMSVPLIKTSGIEACAEVAFNSGSSNTDGKETSTLTGSSSTTVRGTGCSINLRCTGATNTGLDDLDKEKAMSLGCFAWQWMYTGLDPVTGRKEKIGTCSFVVIDQYGKQPQCWENDCDDRTDCQTCLGDKEIDVHGYPIEFGVEYSGKAIKEEKDVEKSEICAEKCYANDACSSWTYEERTKDCKLFDTFRNSPRRKRGVRSGVPSHKEANIDCLGSWNECTDCEQTYMISIDAVGNGNDCDFKHGWVRECCGKGGALIQKSGNHPPSITADGNAYPTLTCNSGIVGSESVNSYKWYNNDVLIPDATSAKLKVERKSGDFTCQVQSDRSLSAKSRVHNVYLPVGAIYYAFKVATYDGLNMNIMNELKRLLATASGHVFNPSEINLLSGNSECISCDVNAEFFGQSERVQEVNQMIISGELGRKLAQEIAKSEIVNSESDLLWEQCGNARRECVAGKTDAATQFDCQVQAKLAGHSFYQYRADKKYCYTVSTCDSPVGTTSDWRIYSESCPAAQIRLVGGRTSLQGRIEVLHDGQWGTVCDDAFGEADAEVACRELGFGPPDSWDDFSGGAGSGPILLDNLNCSGDELFLRDCKHEGWGKHNCGHKEDVSITCTEYTEDVPKIYTLVSKKRECTGAEHSAGRFHTVAECAVACKGKSSMFIYGTNRYGTERCYHDGCACWCELAAHKTTATCHSKSHSGFDLFKYVTPGMAVEEAVSEPEWKQCGQNKRKCEMEGSSDIVSLEECQDLAVTRNHAYIQYYDTNKLCYTTNTCDAPIKTGWTWKIYSKDCSATEPHFELLAKRKECSGKETNPGRFHDINECAAACHGVAPLFIFGTNDHGKPRCYADGCVCWCEIAADKKTKTCNQVNNNGFHLYKFVAPPKKVVDAETCFCMGRAINGATKGADCSAKVDGVPACHVKTGTCSDEAISPFDIALKISKIACASTHCDIDMNVAYGGNSLGSLDRIPTAQHCANKCASMPPCKSWTFHKKGVNNRRCEFFDDKKMRPVKDYNCDSGIPCFRKFTEQELVKYAVTCSSNSQCRNSQFCSAESYICESCDKCNYCVDGIDGTCGHCKNKQDMCTIKKEDTISRDQSKYGFKCSLAEADRAFKSVGSAATEKACIAECLNDDECVAFSAIFGEWCIGCKLPLGKAHNDAVAYIKELGSKEEEEEVFCEAGNGRCGPKHQNTYCAETDNPFCDEYNGICVQMMKSSPSKYNRDNFLKCAPPVPEWKQCGPDNRKCEREPTREVVSLEECQALSVTRNHAYVQYYDKNKFCYTTNNCNSPMKTGWNWKIYSKDCPNVESALQVEESIGKDVGSVMNMDINENMKESIAVNNEIEVGVEFAEGNMDTQATSSKFFYSMCVTGLVFVGGMTGTYWLARKNVEKSYLI